MKTKIIKKITKRNTKRIPRKSKMIKITYRQEFLDDIMLGSSIRPSQLRIDGKKLEFYQVVSLKVNPRNEYSRIVVLSDGEENFEIIGGAYRKWDVKMKTNLA